MIIASAIALHAASLVSALFRPNGLDLGIGNTLSLLAWLITLFVFASNFWQKLSSLYPILFLISGVSAICQVILPGHHIPLNTSLPLFRLHLLVALSAYSLLSITTLLAIFIAMVDYNLHHIRSSKLLQGLPPLLALEKLLFNTMAGGFILLTAAMLSGAYFTHRINGAWFQANHKNIFSLMSWLVFGYLLLGHYLKGWRGRMAARLTIMGSSMLLLGYVGSKFVIEVLLHKN